MAKITIEIEDTFEAGMPVTVEINGTPYFDLTDPSGASLTFAQRIAASVIAHIAQCQRVSFATVERIETLEFEPIASKAVN